MRNTKLILGIGVGILVGGVIGIKASELIESSQVVYKDNQTVDVALDNLFDELNLGKTKIAEAITAKGVETTSEKTLEEMANNINVINNNFSIEIGEILWNYDGKSFSSQTITIDQAEYSYIFIQFTLQTHYDVYPIWCIHKVGVSETCGAGYSYGGYGQSRNVTFSDNDITFSSGISGTGINDAVIIPRIIYGIK